MTTSAAFDRRSIPGDAVEHRWVAPDGHAIRRIDWSKADQPIGSLLFLPGRGDCYEKYIEAFDHWRRRGWNVASVDWRGQGGSGRFGLDDVTGHIGNFAYWVGDLAEFCAEWSQGSTGPHVIVAHSMGAMVAVQALVDRALQPAPAGLVVVGPMLDVPPVNLPRWVKWLVARAMGLFGDVRRQAWKWSDTPGEVPPDRKVLLTHDDERYADEMWWRAKRQELAMGPGSWGWVAAALAASRRIFRAGALEAVDVPVFFVATSADRLVPVGTIHQAIRRLPRASALWFGDEAGHEILREADPVRDRALAGIDEFLEGIARG